MSANSKSGISCSIQDSSKLAARYSNRLRGHFLGSLSRTGSCESGISKAGQSSPQLSLKSKLKQEILHLSQALSSEQLSLEPQKGIYHTELRRVIKAISDTAAEVSSFGNVQAKSLASLGPEELKRCQASASDDCVKAREQGKFLDEAIAKLKNFRCNLSSRKRIRSEQRASGNRNSSLVNYLSAGGAVLIKSASPLLKSQANLKFVDVVPHRADKRNKTVVTDKQVCTLVLEGHLNVNLPISFGKLEREIDVLKHGSSYLSEVEENDCAQLLDKRILEKMRIKGKHSRLKTDICLPSMVNEASDGKCEHKLSSKDQHNNDGRVKQSEVHGYSKQRRLRIKKSSSDYNPLTQPSYPVNSGSSDLTGGMDDDYKELLAAVEDVNNSRSLACSKPFWKEMEPYFRIVTQDDLDYLKQQVMFGHPSRNYPSHQKSLSSANVEDNNLSFSNNQADMQVTRSSAGTDGIWLETMTPLSQRLLSALIVVDENEQVTRIDNDNGHKNFDCATEVSPHISHLDKYGEDKTFSRIDKSGVVYDILEGSTSDIDISKADSGNLKEKHIIGLQKNQSGHQTNCVASDIATHEIEYQKMSLDEKILLELHSIGLFVDSVPDLESEDDDSIEEELNKLKIELQEKICETEAQIIHLEKAVSESWKLEERERERHALNKLVLRASKRYLGPRGRGFHRRSAAKKVEQQANLDFVKRTLHRCKKFDETGRSCFNETLLKAKFFRVASKETTIKSVENAIEGKIFHANQIGGDTGSPSGVKPSDDLVVASQNFVRHAVHTHKKDKGDNLQSDPHQVTSSVQQTSGKLFLEGVVGRSAPREVPVFTRSLLKGAKEKICEREKEGKGQNKETIMSMNNVKKGLQGNIKGKKKSTSKSNQRTTQLLESNGLLGKSTGELSKSSTTLINLEEKTSNKFVKENNDFTMESVLVVAQDLKFEPLVIDLSHVELPVVDYVDKLDVYENCENFESFFEDDALQDATADSAGLGVSAEEPYVIAK